MTATVFSGRDQGIALFLGALIHLLFVVAVGIMGWQLHDGPIHGFGPFHGWAAIVANLLLVLQFINLHSWLLSPRGKSCLSRIGPKRLVRKLCYPSFVAVTSLQLLATFLLWSPSGTEWVRPHGDLALAWNLLFGLSWIFLIKAMIALVWGAYCLHAQILKERRYARRYGEAFLQYQLQVPYCLPGFHPRRARRS